MQGAGEDRLVRDAGELEPRAGGGQRAELVARPGRARRSPPAIRTPPESTTRAGSSDRDDGGDARARAGAPSVGEELVAGARGRVSAAATAAGGASAAQARATGRARAPAGRRRAPGSRRRCRGGRRVRAGVPGSGRKPTSPAPPVAPPCRRPSITIAAPSPSSAHSRTKSSTPAGPPDSQLGDGGEVHVVLDARRAPDRVGEPVEQVGVVPAGQVAGVAQPARRRVERARACRSRRWRRSDTGEPRGVGGARRAPARRAARRPAAVPRGVRSSYSPTVRPVMSATAARIRAGVTSSAATWAASGFTA